MNDEKMFDVIRQAARENGVFDLVRVTIFKGHRLDVDEHPREVTISVRDSGEAADPNRWYVLVTDEDGRSVGGERATELEAAIQTTPWSKLDEPLA